MKIGIDVDGVLADFQKAYTETTISVSGMDLFPPRPFPIPCWEYPQYFGYADETVKRVWRTISQNPTFWETLEAYPHTEDALFYLQRCVRRGDDLYFITDRPGIDVKGQTERWLRTFNVYGNAIGHPTVLISSHKGLCARALSLDVYLDDKPENCANVVKDSPNTKVFMFNQNYNRPHDVAGATRVDSVVNFAEALRLEPQTC